MAGQEGKEMWKEWKRQEEGKVKEGQSGVQGGGGEAGGDEGEGESLGRPKGGE